MTHNYHKKILAVAVACLSSPTWALDTLTDDSLGEVTGQDGIQLVSTASDIKAGSAFWQDDGRELRLSDLEITPNSATDFTLATIGLDVGSSNPTATGRPAIGMSATVAPSLLTVKEVCVTDSNAAPGCGSKSMGELALRTNNDTTINFFNTNGFFDSTTNNARVRVNIDDAELYLAQSFGGRRNLLILNNIFVNNRFDGRLSIDATDGIRAQGTANFTRTGNNNGLQYDIYYNENIASGFTTAGAKGILFVGMSGTINNLDLKMRGDNSLTGSGTQGIKLNLSGILSRGNFSFELGDAAPMGSNADSLRFSRWVDFSDGAAVNPSSPDITLGDIYLNLLDTGATLPSLTSTVSGFTFDTFAAADKAYSVAVRGLNFQAYPKVVSFRDIDSDTVRDQNWSAITTLHDVDANLTLMGGGHPSVATPRGIGFDMQLAATGRNASGTEGTHVLIADPVVGTYLGVRNINLAGEIKGGQLYLADTATDGVSGIRLTAERLKLAATGQMAVGKLPNGGTVPNIPDTGYTSGLAVQIESGPGTHFTLSPPSSGTHFAYSAALRLQDTNDIDFINSNSITVSDPHATGGNYPSFQMGNITGSLDIINGKIDTISDATDSINFEYTLHANPNNIVGEEFKTNVRVITGGATPITNEWGVLVVPTGQLYSKLTIKPQ